MGKEGQSVIASVEIIVTETYVRVNGYYRKSVRVRRSFLKIPRKTWGEFSVFENSSKQIRCIYTRRRLLAIPSRSFWNSKQIRCSYTSDFCPLPPEGQRANPMSTHLLLSWDSHTLMRWLMPAVIYLYRRFSFRRKRT